MKSRHLIINVKTTSSFILSLAQQQLVTTREITNHILSVPSEMISMSSYRLSKYVFILGCTYLDHLRLY
uniref:Uncharacterized protein n=1 Tax=Arion vulgaris TaxID=1028688 RepID=A0A0B7BIK4_9EUPU